MERKLALKERELFIGGGIRYNDRQLIELIDIAEVFKRAQEESLDKVFSMESLEKELLSLGYSPSIVSNALTQFKDKELKSSQKLWGKDLETLISGYEKCNKLSNKLSQEWGDTTVLTTSVGALGGIIVGFAGAFALGVHWWGWDTNPAASPGTLLLTGMAIGALMGGIPTYILSKHGHKKLKNEHRKLEKERESKLLEAQQIWQSPKEIVQAGDLVVVDHSGYHIAYAREICSDKLKIVRDYTHSNANETIRNIREEQIGLSQLVAILEPKSYIPLSIPEIKSLPFGSMLVCFGEREFTFGYLGNKTDAGFTIYSDKKNNFVTGNYQYPEMENVKLFPLGIKPIY